MSEICCKNGIKTVRDEIVSQEGSTINNRLKATLQGMVKVAVYRVKDNPDIAVGILANDLRNSKIDFEKVQGFRGEPLVYYRGIEEADEKFPDSDITGSKLAVAVATCATRASTECDLECEILLPIEVPVTIGSK